MSASPARTEAYTSTVVAPIQLVIAVVFAAALGAVTISTGAPPWSTVIAVAALLMTGGYVSVVRLAIGSGRIVLAQGPCGGSRVIDAGQVLQVGVTDLTWPQVFGLGVAFAWRTTRMTVRPGSTLCLKLRAGEQIRVSVRDAATARRVLESLRPEGAPA